MSDIKMSDINMSDVFNLPLNSDYDSVNSSTGNELAAFDTCAEDDAAVSAINSHDKLTKQVAELRAALGDAADYLQVNTDSQPARILIMKCDKALKDSES